MNLSASAKQAVDKVNTLLDKAAHHPLMDKLDHGLQMLQAEKIKSAYSKLIEKIRGNAAVVAVTSYTDEQITRAANSAAMGRLEQYAILVRLNKPIGILLLLWPTLISLWIAAQGWPDTKVLAVFVMGVILMRSAGCAINDYADRDIDGSVARTKDRPIVSGKVSEKEALLVFAALSICAFGLVLLMNRLTIMMSLVGVVLAASYPFMKRYHFLPQVHLGAAFGWTVPMAFTAQANELTPVTWLLFLATVLWTTAYDTMYAMADRADDVKIGVKSTAILFGPLDKKIIGIIQAMLIMALILLGQRAELSGFYYTGVAAATVLALWQQYLIKDRDPALCFKAFLNNNWFGLVLFAGLVLDYQFKGIT
jgi:4-hydroxybenzoate polyprenyltransferase